MKFTLGFLLVAITSVSHAAEPSEPAGSATYARHCSGCHGARLEGASATGLIKTEWQYGRDGFSVESNISHGIPGTDMPAFRAVLSAADIAAVVEYLYAAQTSPPGEAEPIPARLSTALYELRTERLVTDGIGNPWSIGFVDRRTALISDNDGELYRLVDGKLDPRPILGVPEVDRATSTGGLLGLAIDPHFDSNGWVYLAISHSEDPDDRYAPGLTRIIRGRVRDYEWVDTQYLFRLGPHFHLPDSKHWGGRLLFDRAGHLFFSVGDMSAPMNAQDLTMPSGKVYRLNADGSVPADNPFVARRDALASIYSFGNRNVQGLAQHPTTGEIWATEHGPRGGDELNRLLPGRNYGWPVVTNGINYDGSIISELTEKEGIEASVKHWTPAPIVSQITFVTSPSFARWNGDLLLASLGYEELRRLTLDGDDVVAEEVLFKGYGRIRDVAQGPDGALYLVFNNPGSVVRVTPLD